MTDALAALAEAEAHLRDGAGAKALDALIAAWRAKRVAAISALVSALSPRLDRAPIPKAKTQKQQLLDWIARARQGDPADLHLLVTTMSPLWDRGRPSPLVAALDELTQRKDDPRSSALGIAWIADHATTRIHEKVFRRLGRLVVAARDPTSREALIALKRPDDSYESFWFNDQLNRSLRALDKALAGLDAEVGSVNGELTRRTQSLARLIDEARLDPSLDVRPAETGRTQQLFAAVYETPEDDGARMVLADHLLERGDLRGELISLQLQPAAASTRITKARERRLLGAHGMTWMGGISRLAIKRSVIFQRGFLAACRLKTIKAAQATAEEHHPEWATVERLEFNPHVSGWGSFVSERMRSMKALVQLCRRGLQKLCVEVAHLPLEELEVAYDETSDPDPLTNAVSLLSSCEGLSALRTLTFSGYRASPVAALEPLWDSPIGDRLDTLVFNDGGMVNWRAERFPVRRVAAVEGRAALAITHDADKPDLWARFDLRDDSRGLGRHSLVRRVLQRADLSGYATATVEIIGDDPTMMAAEEVADKLYGNRGPDVALARAKPDSPLPWQRIPRGCRVSK